MRYYWVSLCLLIAAVIAFVGTAVGTRLSLADLMVRDAERREALQLDTELQRLLTLLVDIETGQRGYIITGQLPFLRPYEEALQELGKQREGLRVRLQRNGAPTEMLDRLDQLIDARIQHSRQSVERRVDHTAIAQDLGPYVEGKRLMDDLRFQVDQLALEQQRRIADVDLLAEDVQQRTTWLTKSLLGVGLVALALALALMFYERRLRDLAETALRVANAGLEQQVAQRTEALSQALLRIRSFATELDRSIEDERRRLAREVHDQIGQVGTAIKMIVATLRAEPPSRAEPLFKELEVLADDTIRSARHISAALRPPLLDELGLEAALGHYLQTLGRQSGLTTRLELDAAELLTPQQANPLFRIVQEASTNVLRHAHATALRVTGRPRVQAGESGYELEIVDNGRGPGGTRPDASGLRGMRERAALAGGDFDFGAALEHGTRVRVWLPLEPPGAGDQDAQEEEAWT
ncbi:CHASE3 domain-containing protein [Roseateles sp. DC23W]|uniref:histidine kinase n=1 Tax=Pelomonas dachongensis TaxID=3299029 RepID=A0ABW7EML6_9BURK